MRAIVWQGDKRFEVQEVPKPVPGPGQILVKVEAAAVCSSDMHLADFRCKAPLIPGHEVAGTVEELGEGVNGFALGDRVALDPVQRCGSCWCCLNQCEHLCANYRHLGDREIAGGWAEYVAIDAVNAHLIPPGIPFEAAALTEPSAVCFHSLHRARLEPGQDVLVLGDGPFAFLHTQLALALGARKVVVVGHMDQRLRRITQTTGVPVCNSLTEDVDEFVRSHFGLPGPDAAIEASGSPEAPDVALRLLRPRGTLVIFSYIWDPKPITVGLIHMRELNVVGSCRSWNAYEPCLRLMSEGRINTMALVDLQAALSDCNRVLTCLQDRKPEIFKAVFRPQWE
ncbi:MAG: zinc-binding dehydrogenase [Acidobacteriota bacterium]